MIASQTFIQTTPALTWTINHNFNAAPVCDVMTQNNGVVSKMLPMSVKHVSNTQLMIEFSEPTSGTARLVGKFTQTAPTSAGSVDMGQNL